MDSNITIMSCPKCGKKYRVPTNRGKLEISCTDSNCNHVFFYEPEDYYANLLHASIRNTEEKARERALEDAREKERSKRSDNPIDGYEKYIKETILASSEFRTSGSLKGYFCTRSSYLYGLGMDAERPPERISREIYNYVLHYGGRSEEKIYDYSLTHINVKQEFSVNEANSIIMELKRRLSKCGFKEVVLKTEQVYEKHYEPDGLFSYWTNKSKEVTTAKPDTVYIFATINW